jgi:putative addiction module antidote
MARAEVRGRGAREKSPAKIVKHLLNGGIRLVIQMYNKALIWIRRCGPNSSNVLSAIGRNRKGICPMKIEIKKIGNSDGLLIPRELMQRLDLKRGQQLHITELPGGGFQALPYDPDFERTMELAEETMDTYRDTLATLAK